MKNNRGFTLVEVLAVLVILVLIMTIITPKVFKQFEHAEKVTDQEQINALINTSKIYMNQNSNLLPAENDTYIISLDDLKESGLIKSSQILNPSTKEELKGCILVKYENNKYKYEYKEENEQITVTFDPQGGTLQETSKNVILGEKYGTLPIPTREGYTFVGWNGKNIIDKSQSVIDGIKNDIPFEAWARTSFDNNWVINNLKPNTQYSISYDIEGISVPEYTSEYSGNLAFYLYSLASQPGTYLMSGNGYYISVGEKYHYQLTFTTPSSVNLPESKYVLYTYSNRYLKNNVGVFSRIKLYNLQIEEGNTATEYEPYYITSDTKVVQQKNHTLKAIWQAN